MAVQLAQATVEVDAVFTGEARRVIALQAAIDLNAGINTHSYSANGIVVAAKQFEEYLKGPEVNGNGRS